MRGTLIVSAMQESLFEAAADRIAAALAMDGSQQDTVRFVLAGGRTPRGLYQRLASPEVAGRVPWQKIHIFWGDERLVPHDHAESNFRMARENLLQHLPLTPEQVHPVPTNHGALGAAEAYEDNLRQHFRLRKGFPVFDLILLGLGADGHIASLFPHTGTLDEQVRWVTTARSLAGNARISLTLPVLNQARRIFFLVTGKGKAAALQKAVEEVGRLPAQRVSPRRGELVWLTDWAAASKLTQVQIGE